MPPTYLTITFIEQNAGSLLIQKMITNESGVYKHLGWSKGLLNKQEIIVLQLLAQGYTNQQIADKTDIGVKSVETYRLQLSKKLGLHNRVELINYASKMGLLNPNNLEVWKLMQNTSRKTSK